MRILLIFSTLITGLVFFVQPFSVAIPMPAPSVSIDIVPNHLDINATGSNSTNVEFRVDVGVSKMPRQQLTVTLSVSMDTGWYCLIKPDTMEFTNLTMDQWIVGYCCITVPAGISNKESELTVSGTSVYNGLSTTVNSKATLMVDPLPPGAINQTGNDSNSSNVTVPETINLVNEGGDGKSNFLGIDKGMLFPILAASVLLLVVAVTGYVAIRIKRRKNPDA